MISAEQKYETHNEELLTIVKSFHHWWHYLKGFTHSVEVLSNHFSLWSFMTTHKLLWRQIWWALTLSAYDFVIIYWKGHLNSADSSSQRPNHQHEAEQENQTENASVLQQILFSTVALISVKPRDDLLTQKLHLCEVLVAGTTSSQQWSQQKQTSEAVLDEESYEKIDTSLTEILSEFLQIDSLMKHMLKQITACEVNSEMSNFHSLWSQRDDLLYFDSVLYIPHAESLWLRIIKKHHNELFADHLTTEKTFALIHTKYYWLNMQKQIQKYCNFYLVCQRAQIICEKQSELLQFIFTLKRLWEVLTLDFITDLSESHAYESVYNAILMMMCKFSKMSHYISVRKDWITDQLTETFVEEIVKLHKVSQALISDHRSVFTFRLWVNLMFTLKIECQLSTAFHSQTDKQTEQQNNTLKQYLWSYINYQQNNWVLLLALIEFAYNVSWHSFTVKAPFEVVYNSVPKSDMLTAEKLAKYSAVNRITTEVKQLTEHLHNTQIEVWRAFAKLQKY